MEGQPAAHRFSRRTRIAMVLGLVPFLAILACPVAAFLVVRHQLNENAMERDEARAEAEVMVQQRVREYARAVITEGDPEIPAQRLDALTDYRNLMVRRISRDHGLLLVVQGHEQYGPWPTRRLTACYELAFADLGTATARYESRLLDDCPRRSRPPASPTGSRSSTG